WAGLAAALERGDFRHGLSTAWPPLYPALISAALRIARMAGLAPAPGTLEICARAVSVVAGALLLVPLYALARRLLSPRAAVIAVTLAAVHPRTLQYSAAALSEATFTLPLLAALALLVRGEGRVQLLARVRDRVRRGLPRAGRARGAREREPRDRASCGGGRRSRPRVHAPASGRCDRALCAQPSHHPREHPAGHALL